MIHGRAMTVGRVEHCETHAGERPMMGFAVEDGQEIAIGWIGAVRPSRRPLSRPPQDEEFS
jgi:hypothetical protein